MVHKPTLRALLFFSVLLLRGVLKPVLVAYFEGKAVGPEAHTCAVGAVAADDADFEVVAAVAEAAENGAVEEFLLVCKGHTSPQEAALGMFVAAGPCPVLGTLAATVEAAELGLAQSIHSSHDRGCWNQGYFVVEGKEILTWAERGMPLSTRCRTPLWPN